MRLESLESARTDPATSDRVDDARDPSSPIATAHADETLIAYLLTLSVTRRLELNDAAMQAALVLRGGTAGRGGRGREP